MTINGEIRQLYADREKTKPIYPRVSSNAVFLGNGNNLEASVQSTQSDIDNLKYVLVQLPSSGWSGSAPYTQTVSVSGMTEDWVPGVPSLALYGTVDVTKLITKTEALGCIKMITSAAGTLTFTAPEDKPSEWLDLRVPGQVMA